jgi:hypothetical protein
MRAFPIRFPFNTRCFIVVIILFATLAQNAVSVEDETVTEVSIIGNTELPNKNFNLPWRLPSIEKREEQSPPTMLPDMLSPLEPKRYRQQLHFSDYLQVDTINFRPR